METDTTLGYWRTPGFLFSLAHLIIVVINLGGHLIARYLSMLLCAGRKRHKYIRDCGCICTWLYHDYGYLDHASDG